MKRYLIFVFHSFNAKGGWNDCLCGFDSLEAAQKELHRAAAEDYGSAWGSQSTHKYDQGHIVDTVTGKIVEDITMGAPTETLHRS
jgi:hypothetical protein